MNFVEVVLIVLTVILGAGFVIYLYLIKPGKTNLEEMKEMQRFYYAHRGLYDNQEEWPENSIPAFCRAVEYGFGTELDVQLTTDGRLVVFHDMTLKRMCGESKKLYECSFAELQEYCLKESQQKIPLFSEVLKAIDGKIPMIIEVKDYHDWESIVISLCQHLEGYNGEYSIVSFSPYVLQWFRKNRPEVLRGQIVMGMKWNWKKGKKKYLRKLPGMYMLANVMGRPNYLSYNVGYLNNLSFQICSKLFGIFNLNWPTHSQEELEGHDGKKDMNVFEWFIPER